MAQAAITALVTSVVAAPVAAAMVPGFRRATIYDGQVSLDIPNDWREIPEIELEDATFIAAEATGGRVVEIYKHGFRPADAVNDRGLPQLLVQIRESGRLRYGQFLELPPLGEFQDNAKRSYPQGVPPFVVGVEIDRVAFDRERFAILIEHSLSLRFIGQVKVLTAALLTERGFLVFHLTDRSAQADASRALLDRILGSVHLDPELEYHARVTDRWPGLPFFAAAGVLTVILVIFIVRRRRSQP